MGRGAFPGSLGPSWQSAPRKPGQHLHSNCVTILYLVTYLGLKFTRYLWEKRVASLYWLLSQASRMDSRDKDPGHSGPCLLPASLLHPAVTSWGPAHILLASSLYFLGSTHPQPGTPLTNGWGNRQLSKTWPIGRGQFSQTELLFHQQTLFQSSLFCGQFFRCHSVMVLEMHPLAWPA